MMNRNIVLENAVNFIEDAMKHPNCEMYSGTLDLNEDEVFTLTVNTAKGEIHVVDENLMFFLGKDDSALFTSFDYQKSPELNRKVLEEILDFLDENKK